MRQRRQVFPPPREAERNMKTFDSDIAPHRGDEKSQYSSGELFRQLAWCVPGSRKAVQLQSELGRLAECAEQEIGRKQAFRHE